jgi:small subunit ribosomal protein S6
VYEVLCVLDPALREEEQEAAISRLGELVARQGGEVREVQRWGRRRLGYEVRKRREGIYVLLRAALPPPAVPEISRHLRIAETVLRHMVVRVDGARRASAPGGAAAAGPAAGGEAPATPAPAASAGEL